MGADACRHPDGSRWRLLTCGIWMALAVALVLVAPRTVGADDTSENSSRPGWVYAVPVGNILAVNGSIWATARFLLDMDYADIGMDTIGVNFANGFEWDSDGFRMNQLAHPYHGGLYHAGARVVGFGFWASSAYTLLGSLQWEMFMENELPSVNDLITTTVGGIVLGEATFRLSSALLDESACGLERGLREGGALVLSPIHGLSRVFTGAVSRRGSASSTTPVALQVAFGLDDLDVDELDDAVLTYGFDTRLTYGSFHDADEAFAPFDWYSLAVGFNYGHSEEIYTAEFDITGLLARWNIGCGEGNDCVWGPNMHYDFYDTPLFKVGSSSLGLTALGDVDLGWWSLELSSELDLGVILLGGFDSPYAEAVGRDYNLGSGGFARARLELNKPGWFRLRASSSRHYVRTLHGADGHELAGITRGQLEVPIYGGFGVSLGSLVYDRERMPDDFDDEISSQVATQLQLLWRL